MSALKLARPDSVPCRVVITDGTAGLADQAVLKGTSGLDRGSDNSKYAALVPLALAAYVVGGVDGLQDLMISLLKDAVMVMAYNVDDIGDVFKNNEILDGYTADNVSTWYLTQDASESDKKYNEALSKNSVGADSLLGRVLTMRNVV